MHDIPGGGLVVATVCCEAVTVVELAVGCELLGLGTMPCNLL